MNRPTNNLVWRSFGGYAHRAIYAASRTLDADGKVAQGKRSDRMYLSGHPLDDYRLEFDSFVTCDLNRAEEFKNKEISVAGVVTDHYEKISKNNKPYGGFTVEDYSGNMRMILWSEDYLRFNTF